MIAKLTIAAAAATLLCTPVFAKSVKVPEGTELSMRFDDGVSSATNTLGDRFTISMDDQVTLADGTVIAAGGKGVGEVTAAEKKGMMGKAGQLNVRYEYVRIGETRVRLRGSRGAEGKGAVGATVALTVLSGPLGLIKKGHDVTIKSGQHFTAFVDQDTMVTLPDDAAAAVAP